MMKGVIFDFDGVVVDSELYFRKAKIEVFARFGIPLTQSVATQYLGLKMDDYISALEKRYDTSVDHAQVTDVLHIEIVRLYEYKIPLVEHVQDVLAEIHEKFPIALATSREKHLARLIMKRLEIEKYFDNGVYRDDVKHGKPDPEVYLKAAAMINIDPQYCAAVEDAENGFKSGKAAGMFIIGRKAEHNKDQDFSLADEVITDLRNIPRILSRL